MTSILDPTVRVDYTPGVTPPSYRCTVCGKHGAKLWREYQYLGSRRILKCADCVARAVIIDAACIADDGTRNLAGSRTDRYGAWVPAVPTPANDAFHLFAEIPPAAYEWWAALPLR